MPVEVILPKVDMAMETGSIETWKVSEGDKVKEGDLLFEIGTDKSVMEVEAPASGTIRAIATQTGVQIPVGTVVALIYKEGEAQEAPPQPASPAAPASAAPSFVPSSLALSVKQAAPPTHAGDGGIRATPLARRIARDNAIDLAGVSGSGPHGRIHERDVAPLAGKAAFTSPPALLRSVPAPMGQGRFVPFSPIRKIIASRLADSTRTAPHFYMTAQIDMSALIALQRKIAARLERRTGLKPSLTVILARLAGPLLIDHPMLNASVEGEGARLHDEAHIGIAMEREGDLVVPVLRHCQAMSIEALTVEFARLRDEVKARTIAPADMRGGTFTISNLGMYGVDAFTAIINPPEAAILAVGRMVDTPVGIGGKVKLRPLATFSLSSDHRIVDGVAAAKFMKDLREAIEHPEMLL